MKLIDPMQEVKAWLRALRDDGSEMVADAVEKANPRSLKVPTRLLDPSRINVIEDPAAESRRHKQSQEGQFKL